MVKIRHVVVLHPKGFIAECQHLAIAHGLQNGGQELLAGGNLLQEDAVLQQTALLQLAVERKCIEEPPFEAGTVLKVAAIGDLVGVGAFVAGNLDTEQLVHRRHMVMERAFRIGLPAGKSEVPLPFVADSAERDSLEPRLIHRVYQPDILSNQLLCHNNWI